jgi:hypothetical protein
MPLFKGPPTHINTTISLIEFIRRTTNTSQSRNTDGAPRPSTHTRTRAQTHTFAIDTRVSIAEVGGECGSTIYSKYSRMVRIFLLQNLSKALDKDKVIMDSSSFYK